MTDSAIQLDRRDDVAIVRFDQPNKAVNTLSPAVVEEFEALLDTLEGDADLRGVVLISGKETGFIAGADIEALRDIEDPEAIAALSSRGNALLNRLARLKPTTVAAIHGPAMGGGLEVALACDLRIASDDPGTRFALPEVKLGLLPAGGGTQRLPRLIGLPAALDMMLTGRNIYPHRALKLGLIDHLIHAPGLLSAAVAASRGSLRRRRLSVAQRALLKAGPARRFVLRKAAENVRRKTRGLYPAPEKIIEVVETGLSRGMDAGLDAESKAFGQLQQSPESKALVSLFFAMQKAKKRDDPEHAVQVERVAMIGAGFMGTGIAQVSIATEIDVTLRDVSDEALARARKTVWDDLSRKVARRAIRPSARDRLAGRLHATTELAAIAGADAVIEAVFEDLDLKRKLLAEIESVVESDVLIASNTSSLPIADIAAEAQHPERVLGMHYFSPVPKMPLLEIIAPDGVDATALATAVHLGIRQGKTVIVVADSPGFYTSRVLSTMLNEVLEILGEGAAFDAVDRAMKDWGFPVGPVALMDEVGLDVGAYVRRGALGKMFAERGVEGSDALQRMVDAGLKGRKAGRGFYLYARRRKRVNPEAYEFFGGSERKDMDPAEIQERVGLMFVNEAIRCLEESVLSSPTDGDLGAILGLGFPPMRGGPFRYVDQQGAADVHARIRALNDRFGERFEPAGLLAEHAKDDRRFHEGSAK